MALFAFSFPWIDELVEEPDKHSIKELADICELYYRAYEAGMVECGVEDIDELKDAYYAIQEYAGAAARSCYDLVDSGYFKATVSVEFIERLDASPIESWVRAYKAGVSVEDILAGA